MDTKEKEISMKSFDKDIYNSFQENNKNESKEIENCKETEDITKTKSTNFYSLVDSSMTVEIKKEIISNLNSPDNLKIYIKYEVIHYQKIISNMKDEYKKDKKEKHIFPIKTNEYLKELNNKYYVSGGINCKTNFYYFDGEEYQKIQSSIKKEDLVYSLYENPNKEQKDKFSLIFCCVDKCYIYKCQYIDNNNNYLYMTKIRDFKQSGLNSFSISNINSKIAILGENGVFLISNLFNEVFLETIEKLD